MYALTTIRHGYVDDAGVNHVVEVPEGSEIPSEIPDEVVDELVKIGSAGKAPLAKEGLDVGDALDEKQARIEELEKALAEAKAQLAENASTEAKTEAKPAAPADKK